VARAARAKAANPFESVLRAHALGVGLDVEPQVPVRHGREWVVPDLVDRGRRLVLEADSFAWHGQRAALRRDCQRYNWLVRHGWSVLRLAYEDVMFDEPYVLELLGAMRTRKWT
jgi:very-short-patch-repair endonuclease